MNWRQPVARWQMSPMGRRQVFWLHFFFVKFSSHGEKNLLYGHTSQYYSNQSGLNFKIGYEKIVFNKFSFTRITLNSITFSRGQRGPNKSITPFWKKKCWKKEWNQIRLCLVFLQQQQQDSSTNLFEINCLKCTQFHHPPWQAYV